MASLRKEAQRRAALYAIRYAGRRTLYFRDRILMAEAKKIADKLNKQIEQGHDEVAFTIALLLATFKDGVLDLVLDIIGIGEIPFIGQIPGILVSGILMYFLWGKGWFRKTKIRIMYWILGFFFDNLPAFNNLPINVLVVLYAWHHVRKDMREAEEKMEHLEVETGRALQQAA